MTQSTIGLSQDSLQSSGNTDSVVVADTIHSDSFWYSEAEVRRMYKIIVGYDSTLALAEVRKDIILVKDYQVLKYRKERKFYFIGGIIAGILVQSIYGGLVR